MRTLTLRLKLSKLKRYGTLFCLSLFLGSWLWVQLPHAIAPAVAQNSDESVDDLKKKKEALDQQRETVTEDRQRLERLESAAAEHLDGLQNTIEVTSLKIEETEYQIERSQQELKALEAKLAAAQMDYEQVRSAAVGRLQFMQRQQGSEGWAVLLQSQNLNEFLERRYQLRRVYAADRDFLSELKAKADDIIRQQQSVEAQKNSIALQRQQLLAQRDQVSAQAQQQAQLVTRLQDNRSALEAAEAQLVKDSESLGGLIRQKVAAARGGIVGTGQMIFPTPGSITSRFGTRVHPVLGYRRFHSGIDFGASHGTTINAADSGTVIFAGWYGGYGNAVIVDHGGGLTSLYAHASQLYAREGQSVKQGDAIAAVGSTGLSTGPHLHFEVRRQGSPVNPLEFL
ncbi:MAG: peptidoglycan DD-metalloendopeptidase family protein [Leptolyngbya sp. SIO4C1]|nr:peptidoglycan DD-metalloendopeptidase family protein [Leptolyngbya sp. SIO4C1]